MSYAINTCGVDYDGTAELYVEYRVNVREAPFPETLKVGSFDRFQFDSSRSEETLTLNGIETDIHRYVSFNDPDEPFDWDGYDPNGDWEGSDYYEAYVTNIFTAPPEDLVWSHPVLDGASLPRYFSLLYVSGDEMRTVVQGAQYTFSCADDAPTPPEAPQPEEPAPEDPPVDLTPPEAPQPEEPAPEESPVDPTPPDDPQPEEPAPEEPPVDLTPPEAPQPEEPATEEPPIDPTPPDDPEPEEPAPEEPPVDPTPPEAPQPEEPATEDPPLPEVGDDVNVGQGLYSGDLTLGSDSAVIDPTRQLAIEVVDTVERGVSTLFRGFSDYVATPVFSSAKVIADGAIVAGTFAGSVTRTLLETFAPELAEEGSKILQEGSDALDADRKAVLAWFAERRTENFAADEAERSEKTKKLIEINAVLDGSKAPADALSLDEELDLKAQRAELREELGKTASIGVRGVVGNGAADFTAAELEAAGFLADELAYGGVLSARIGADASVAFEMLWAPVMGGAVVLSGETSVAYGSEVRDTISLAEDTAGRVNLAGGDDWLSGASRSDAILGGTGNDTILGADGDDSLGGGSGDDSLVGGSGMDKLDGGAGDDVYVIDDARDEVVDSEGFDTVEVTNEARFRLVGGAIERALIAADGGDAWILGDGGATEIIGNDARNVLSSGGGQDVLTGGGGIDFFAFERSPVPVDAIITDFDAQDILLLDDRFFGSQDGRVEPRPLSPGEVKELLSAGLVGFSARERELRLDTDGSGSLTTVVTFETIEELDIGDVWLF